MAEKEYHGERIIVRYDPARCRHVAACIQGAPSVFDTTRRPWIVADAADPDLVADVIRRCPTGALHYVLAEGPAEEPDPVTRVIAVPDGPLLIRGDLRLDCGDLGEVRDTRAALCRCGHSANKPFCDGAHERVGWRSLAASDVEPATDRPHSEPAVPPAEC